MKNAFYPRSISLVRKLEPKQTLPKQVLSIQNLSFSNSQEGQTFVKIYPSQISITSRDLIEMIEAKKESIPIKNNVCVLREDILFAIHNFPYDENNSNPTNHNRSNSPNSAEPKRPTNAFILYRTALRKKIKTLFPFFNNSDISKFIGAMWRAASKEVKEKYIKQAMECRRLHKKKYPNFEYNIKKENCDQTATNCEQYSIFNDDWDNYFDLCLQNASIEAASNDIGNVNNASPIPTQSSWDSLGSNSNVDLFNLQKFSIDGLQSSNEWSKVCNIVSEFFPEDSDQMTAIDDRLWATLGGFELVNNSECRTMSHAEEHK